ncbi:MAG: hypothetical protein IKO65_04485 [Victivallales bacterium]|nr:hypothetical protein [Victivallales bacterium]
MNELKRCRVETKPMEPPKETFPTPCPLPAPRLAADVQSSSAVTAAGTTPVASAPPFARG